MTIEIKVPALGESVSEAGIAKLYKKVGDIVAADELLVELETDKVTLEVNAPKAGVITAISVAEGDNVKVGDLIATMKEGAAGASATQSAPKAEEKPQEVKSTSAQTSGATNQHLSPAPQRIIAENNLNAGSISGTGKDGRITKGDALSAVNSGASNQASAKPAANFEKPVERVKMSKLRLKVAERLKESQNTAAILTTFNEVDMTSVMALRTEYKDAFEKKHGIKLGFMSFFVKAAITALKEIPAVNAEIDGTDIVYKNY